MNRKHLLLFGKNFITASALISMLFQSALPFTYALPVYAQVATVTPTDTPTPTTSTTVTPTPTSSTVTPTPASVTPTEAPTPIDTLAPTPTDTPTVTPTMTTTVTPTDTATVTPTATVTATPTPDNSSPTTQPTNANANSQGPPSSSTGSSSNVTPTSQPPTPTVTPVPTQNDNGTVSSTIVKNVSAQSLDLGAPTSNGSATITTNKADYSPTDTAVISGAGFLPNKAYTLEITSSDAPPVDVTTIIQMNDQGAFVYAYQLDGNYRPNYTVYVKDGANVVATTTFTDSSGDGTMTVTPTSVTAGSTNSTLTFTFSAGGVTFPAGSDITVTIPNDWTTPQTNTTNGAGYVKLSGNGGCSQGSPTISGNVITIPQDCSGTGSFSFTYKNPAVPNVVETSTFTTTSKNGSNGSETALASSPTVSITSSAGNPAANLEQCHNGDGSGNFLDCKDPSPSGNTWGSGNAGQNNASLFEGNSQNYRLILTNMPTGTPVTVGISQQFTKGGKMAYDFPTGPGNLGTATTPMGMAGIFPCDDNGVQYITPCDHQVPSLTSTSKFAISNIPANTIPDTTVDGQTRAAQTTYYGISESTLPTRSPQYIYVYGGDSGSFGGYSFSGTSAQVGSGDTDLNWNFTITPTNSTVIIVWGAHISASTDYGTKGTAVTISGSPYHTILDSVTGMNVGNQDMQMAAGAITPASTITINKVAVGGDSTFNYTSTGGSTLNSSFSIQTTSGSGSAIFNGIVPGTYSVTETAPTGGWALTNLVCTATGTGSSATPSTNTNIPTANITIGSGGGANIVCTYTNTLAGTLELKKAWVGTAGQTTLNIGTSASGSDVASQLTGASGAAPLTTGAVAVASGTYYVSESGGLTDYTQSLACTDNGSSVTPGASDSVNVAPGHAVVCTFTNTRNQGKLELKKVWSGTPGSVNLNIGTSVEGSEVTTALVGTSGGTTGQQAVNTGTYYLSETAGTATDLTNYSTTLACTNAAGGTVTVGTNSSVAVANGDVVTCTYTNTRNQGTIELQKVWSGTPGQVTLTIGSTVGGNEVASQLTGPNGTAPLTTGQKTVDTATYYLNESGVNASYTASALSCYNDANNDGSQDNGEVAVTVGGSNAVTVATGQHIICEFTNTRNQGMLLVHKMVDTNGDGTYDVATDFAANTLGFRWGFDSTTPANNTTTFGTLQTLDTNSYSVYENSVSGYHFTGWYNNGGTGSCTNPDGTKFPAAATVSTNTTTSITLCNQRDTGTITVVKHLSPTTDSGLFNLLIDGTVGATDVTNNGTTGAVTVVTGDHTASESAGANTTLSDYTSTYDCVNGLADVASGSGTSTPSFIVATGDNIVCTFTNTRNTGTVELKKAWVGTAGQVHLNIGTTSGGTQVVSTTTGLNGGTPLTTGQQTVNTGTYYFSETAGSGTDLSNYTTTYSCASGSVTVNGSGTTTAGINVYTGNSVVCTFTNTRQTGSLLVHKLADTTGSGNYDSVDSSTFTWGIDASNTTTAMGTDQTLNAGYYNVYENNVPGYKFTGWFYGSPDGEGSCSEPDSTSLPTDLAVAFDSTTEITLCNQMQIPVLTISKFNNTDGNSLHPGDLVLYTIQVTATQSAAENVTVTDLLPKGFIYQSGSWTANVTAGSDPETCPSGDLKACGITTEPTYHSPGTWQLGTMSVGETITLTLEAEVTDIDPGTYKDVAWAQGQSLMGTSVLALAQPTGYVGTNFVGTDVTVTNDKPITSYNATQNLIQSVLGAELPATGANVIWIDLAISLLILGFSSVMIGAIIRRKYND